MINETVVQYFAAPFTYIFQLLEMTGTAVVIELFSLCVKTYVLILLSIKTSQKRISKPFILLSIILTSAMYVDITWIISLANELQLIYIDKITTLSLVLVGWACSIIQYAALAFFIRILISPQSTMNTKHKFIMFTSAVMCCLFIYFAINQPELRSITHYILTAGGAIYAMFLLIPRLIYTIASLRKKTLPKIAMQQAKLLLYLWIVPFAFFEFLQATFMILAPFELFKYPSAFMSVVSTIILSAGLLYSARRIVNIRFLNNEEHVQAKTSIPFVDQFQVLLGNLAQANTFANLETHIQIFLATSLAIPRTKTYVYARPIGDEKIGTQNNVITTTVESFFSLCKERPELLDMVRQAKVLIYDEIAYTNFYTQDKTQERIIAFLEEINADIFLPLYEQNNIIGYIIVERNARNELYNHVERDEFIILGRYVSNIVYLMQNKNLHALVEHEKRIHEYLHQVQQKEARYKESVSFFTGNKQDNIGIIFYKYRRFNFANEAAHKIITININTQQGHPLTKAIKDVVEQVELHQIPVHRLAKDAHNNPLALYGCVGFEHNNIIITAYTPGITDILNTQEVALLKDPTDWEYLLYLKTTQAGHIVNQLIPGRTKPLLDIRIQILKAALSKKAILIHAHSDDEELIAQTIQRITGEKMYTYTLHKDDNPADVATTLFGINSLFDTMTNRPLCEQYNNTGILYIKNIQYLNQELQKELNSLITYGQYKPYKSDHTLQANVRLICSSPSSFEESLFSKSLYLNLSENLITIPTLHTLTEMEFMALVDGIAENILQTQALKNMLELGKKDKSHILYDRPESLKALTQKIEAAIINKSKKNHVYTQTTLDPEYNITDPELLQAARLGKRALKDEKLMLLLWDKFRSQNKIATFLGVNRSSVNRRCKDFNLS